MIVIDASVAVKWLFPEQGSDTAIELLSTGSPPLIAPDLLAIEVYATLVRRANIEKPRRTTMQRLIAEFQDRIMSRAVALVRTPTEALASAASMAIELGHPYRDCIYLALANELECRLVTADARFAARARPRYRNVEMLVG